MDLRCSSSVTQSYAVISLQQSDGKALNVNTTKEVVECAAEDSSSDSEIPAMLLPPPEKKSKGKEKVDSHVEMSGQVERDAPESSPMSRKDAELYKEELLKEETDLRQEIRRQVALFSSLFVEEEKGERGGSCDDICRLVVSIRATGEAE